MSKNKKKRSVESSAARSQGLAPRGAQGERPSSSPGPVRHPTVSVSRARADLAAAGQQEGNPTMLVIALLVSTAFMFAYLHLLVLQQMTQLSGGLAMPDSMMFGYDSGYIVQLAGAMDADALREAVAEAFAAVSAPGWKLELVGGAARNRAKHDADFLATHDSVKVRVAE